MQIISVHWLTIWLQISHRSLWNVKNRNFLSHFSLAILSQLLYDFARFQLHVRFFGILFQVKVEGRTQFLSAVCMSCLEGSGGQPVRCRFCTQPWDGSSLVLGTMYSYDIFAAMPCCSERLKVSPRIRDRPIPTWSFELWPFNERILNASPRMIRSCIYM